MGFYFEKVPRMNHDQTCCTKDNVERDKKLTVCFIKFQSYLNSLMINGQHQLQ